MIAAKGSLILSSPACPRREGGGPNFQRGRDVHPPPRGRRQAVLQLLSVQRAITKWGEDDDEAKQFVSS